MPTFSKGCQKLPIVAKSCLTNICQKFPKVRWILFFTFLFCFISLHIYVVLRDAVASPGSQLTPINLILCQRRESNFTNEPFSKTYKCNLEMQPYKWTSLKKLTNEPFWKNLQMQLTNEPFWEKHKSCTPEYFSFDAATLILGGLLVLGEDIQWIQRWLGRRQKWHFYILKCHFYILGVNFQVSKTGLPCKLEVKILLKYIWTASQQNWSGDQAKLAK